MMRVKELLSLLLKEDPDREVRIALQSMGLDDQLKPYDPDNLRDYNIDFVDVGPDGPTGQTVAIYCTDSFYDESGTEHDAHSWHRQHPDWQRDFVDAPRQQMQKLAAAAAVVSDSDDEPQTLYEAIMRLER